MVEDKRLKNSVVAVELIERRRRRMIGTSWILWLAPAGIMLLVGVLSSSVVDLGTAMVLFFMFGPFAAISHATFNDVFVNRNLRFSRMAFNPYTAVRISKIVLPSFFGGMILGVVCANGYLKLGGYPDQIWYWFAILGLLLFDYRNFLVGAVRSDDHFVVVVHFFYNQRIRRDIIGAVSVVDVDRHLQSCRVALQLEDGPRTYVPRMKFYFVSANSISNKPKLVSYVKRLSSLTSSP